MKKFLKYGVIYAALALFSVVDAKPFGSWYSNSLQSLIVNDPVTFENEVVHDKIVILPGNQMIEFRKPGFYLVTYTAVGNHFDSELTTGPWSLGLYLNGNLIPGSVTATSAGDEGDILEVVGQIIIQADQDDILQLINLTPVDSLELRNDVTPKVINVSASIVIHGLKRIDEHEDHGHHCGCDGDHCHD